MKKYHQHHTTIYLVFKGGLVYKTVYGESPREDRQVLVLGIPLMPGVRAARLASGITVEQEILERARHKGVERVEIDGNYLPRPDAWKNWPPYVERLDLKGYSSYWDHFFVPDSLSSSELKGYIAWRKQHESAVLDPKLVDALFYQEQHEWEPVVGREGIVLPDYEKLRAGDFLTVLPWEVVMDRRRKRNRAIRSGYMHRAHNDLFLIKVEAVEGETTYGVEQGSDNGEVRLFPDDEGRLKLEWKFWENWGMPNRTKEWKPLSGTEMYDYRFEVLRVEGKGENTAVLSDATRNPRLQAMLKGL